MCIMLFVDDVRKVVVSDVFVLKICDEVGICWGDLGIKLKFLDVVVCNVDVDFRFCYEKVWKIFYIWMER